MIGISFEYGIIGIVFCGDFKGFYYFVDQCYNGGKVNGQVFLIGSQFDVEGDMGCWCWMG